MEKLLYKLKCKEIEINVVDDQLKLNLPHQLDCTEILAEVRQNKEALIAFIKNAQGRNNPDQTDCWFDKKEIAGLNLLDKKDFYEVVHQQRKEYVRSLIIGKYAYNLNFYTQVEVLNTEIMRKVINTLVERHESLRTYMVLSDGKVYQGIYDMIPADFEIGYLNLLEEQDEQAKNAKLCTQAYDILFDFQKQPLMAFTMVDYAENIHGVAVTLHHTIADEASVKILKTEIELLYKAFLKGEPNPLPALKLQYKEYAAWVNDFLQSGKGLKSKNFYTQKISESIKLNKARKAKHQNINPALISSPAKSYRQQLQSEIKKYLLTADTDRFFEAEGTITNIYVQPGASFVTYIQAPVLQRLRKFSTQCESSLYMTFTALFAVLFHKVEELASVRFSLPYTTRVFKEFEPIIGWLTSEIITCVEMNEELTIRDLVKTVTNNVLEAADHRFYAHEMIMKDLDIQLNDLSPVLLNFISSQDLLVEDLTPHHDDFGSGHFNFKCTIREHTNCVSLSIQYNTEIYTAEKIEEMLNIYFKLIDSVLQYSELPLSSFIKTV
ncbi:condensation domain-containing protein [Pedobacter cryoconitis]|uniref:condensation domain-containing protein n=1 Tax=Pedobacter cryoconitis TaxID=188932 RepID=UPI00160F4B81|nr:condensation domain-containing protein [Pedobacter cryoconitis]MBB5647619.1 hypothetical protein [Pedobacter cryoconitis]